MKPIFHPSRSKLAQWLDSGGPEKVDLHVSNCDRCAAKLESIDTPTSGLGQALLNILEAPDDLADRMNERVESALRRREELMLLAGLLGIPIETARIVMSSPPDDDHATGQDNDT